MAFASSQSCPVMITGIGLETGLASGRDANWSRLIAGESAIQKHQLNLELGGAQSDSYWGAPAIASSLECDKQTFSSSEPTLKLALRAATEAIDDAKLGLESLPRERIGCVVGTSKGGLHTFGYRHQNQHQKQISKQNEAESWLSIFPNGSAAAIAHQFDLRGPSLCPVAACATGLIAVIRAVDLIREGVCDAVIAGSSDASFLPIVVNSFRRLRVMANRAETASQTCKPFDKNRHGFVVGEGAGIFVLQRADLIPKKQNVYAKWKEGLYLSDATGILQIDPKAETATHLIQSVLQYSQTSPEEIDYINYHGTGTKANDKVETAGVQNVFGKAANHLHGSSLKGALGHLLGAAGSVELALTTLALAKGIIPPTVHLETPDPECHLNYTPNKAVVKPIRSAMKLALGFGGHLAAAIITQPK